MSKLLKRIGIFWIISLMSIMSFVLPAMGQPINNYETYNESEIIQPRTDIKKWV